VPRRASDEELLAGILRVIVRHRPETDVRNALALPPR
jgi:hypothetical protein